MANKRISELSSRTPSATDLMVVGDPTTGYSYKCLVSQVGGVTSVFGRTGAVTAAEGDYSLTLLSDVTINSPASGDILSYNGSSWVNSAGGFVPYTGATQNVSLGEYGILAGWYRLDTTPTGTPTNQGTIYWDDSFNTAAIIMNGTTQEIGHDQFYQAKNSTGSTIPKGTAVGFAGTDGTSGHLLIAPFLADGSNPSSYFMGVTSEEITNGSFGKVQSFGRLDGIDTSAFADGDILYASTTVAGGFQTTVPVAPNNIVQVAAVVAAANNGKLLIRPTLGSKLTSDESVKLTSVANGNVLQYNSTLSVWENVAPSSLSVNNIYTTDGTLTGNRTVTMGGNSLTFLQTQNSTALHTFSNQSTGSSAESYYNVINSNFDMRVGIRGNGTGSFAALERSSGMISYNGDTSLCINATNVNATIKFTTNSFTERMRIFANGNIGINTTTDAGFRLDVNGTMRVQGNTTLSSAATLTLNNSGNTVGVRLQHGTTPARGDGFLFQWAGSNVYGFNAAGLNFLHSGTNNEYLFINRSVFSNGSTGGHAFEFRNGGSFNPTTGTNSFSVIRVNTTYNSTGGTNTITGFLYNPVLTSLAGVTHRAIQTVTGDVLFCTTSGNVGIGTTSPAYNLHVQAAAGATTAVKATNTTTRAYTEWQSYTSGNVMMRGFVGTFHDNSSFQIRTETAHPITFSTTNTERMRIFAGGNIAINTTTDAGFRLDVNGTMRVQGSITQTGTSNTLTLGNGLVFGTDGGTTRIFNSSTIRFQSNTTSAVQHRFQNEVGFNNEAIVSIESGGSVATKTSGNLESLRIVGRRALSSGTAIYAGISLKGSIENTGTFTGTHVGFIYDPTIIGSGFTHLAIHAVTGDVLLCTSSGYVGIGATADTAYKLSVDGDLRIYGNIRTAQPTGGTGVGVWRLGSTATGTFTLDITTCVEIEIGGTLYKLATVS